MGKRKTNQARRAEFAAALERVVVLASGSGFHDGRRADPARDTDQAFRESVTYADRLGAARAELTQLFARALRSRRTA